MFTVPAKVGHRANANDATQARGHGRPCLLANNNKYRKKSKKDKKGPCLVTQVWCPKKNIGLETMARDAGSPVAGSRVCSGPSIRCGCSSGMHSPSSNYHSLQGDHCNHRHHRTPCRGMIASVMFIIVMQHCNSRHVMRNVIYLIQADHLWRWEFLQ